MTRTFTTTLDTKIVFTPQVRRKGGRRFTIHAW